MAVVNAAPNQIGAVGAAIAAEDTLKLVEPERVVYAIGGVDRSYLQGYRDAVNHLVDRLLGGDEAGVPTAEAS